MTKSASFMASSNFTASMIISIPGFNLASRKAIRPAPKPPAAPAPGISLTFLCNALFIMWAKRANASSKITIISSVAPFCGP